LSVGGGRGSHSSEGPEQQLERTQKGDQDLREKNKSRKR
jgi:hypothetical protein